MSTTAIADLCDGFCKLARVIPPALQQQPGGLLAFHLTWRGVCVDVVQEPSGEGRHAFVLFELGPVDLDARDAARVLHDLLSSNFLLLEPNAPTFSCNPVHGAAVLQHVVDLNSTTPGLLYELIEEGVDLALDWRERNLAMPESLHHEGCRVPEELA